MKQYQADFFFDGNKEVFLFYVICVQAMTGSLRLLSGQIVNSFGQGKCT